MGFDERPNRTKGRERRMQESGYCASSIPYNELVKDVVRKTYIATCDSEECNPGNAIWSTYYKSVVKHVSKSTKLCPDCGHALFWKEDKSEV